MVESEKMNSDEAKRIANEFASRGVGGIADLINVAFAADIKAGRDVLASMRPQSITLVRMFVIPFYNYRLRTQLAELVNDWTHVNRRYRDNFRPNMVFAAIADIYPVIITAKEVEQLRELMVMIDPSFKLKGPDILEELRRHIARSVSHRGIMGLVSVIEGKELQYRYIPSHE